MANGKLEGYKLPVDPANKQGTVAHGFVTPQLDKVHQVQSSPPRRVLPIIFIPGIMGSNLRMTEERQEELHETHNVAWRPDRKGTTASSSNDNASERQRRLDPRTTVVDSYDPVNNPTGNPDETSDQRNSAVTFNGFYTAGWRYRLSGPVLQDDPRHLKNFKTSSQKARERGWGEVYFKSYSEVLSRCEVLLNSPFQEHGALNKLLDQSIAGVNPRSWQAHVSPDMQPLSASDISDILKKTWFPVHAMGYNSPRYTQVPLAVPAGLKTRLHSMT
jgi:hypothetical protein